MLNAISQTLSHIVHIVRTRVPVGTTVARSANPAPAGLARGGVNQIGRETNALSFNPLHHFADWFLLQIKAHALHGETFTEI